jgi:hypothetical protein
MNVERRNFVQGADPGKEGSQSRNGEPGSDSIDKIGSRDLAREMGKAISPRGDMPKNRVRIPQRTPHVRNQAPTPWFR